MSPLYRVIMIKDINDNQQVTNYKSEIKFFTGFNNN